MKNITRLGIYLLFLTLCFGGILYQLALVAGDSELHSHILLIPFLVGFLIFRVRGQLPRNYERSKLGGLVCASVGLGLLITGILGKGSFSQNDWLAIGMASYLSFLTGGLFFFLGKSWIKAAGFSLFFLVFLIPLPDVVVHLTENFLVQFTAMILEPLFQIAGVPALREGQVFHVPGITIEVARQCSGIRSTLVLVIVGILASVLFLKTSRYRVFLIALLIPLGILRNAFRILVIASLCVYRGPDMINSPIHREGGPVFFGISLVVLFVMVVLLQRIETIMTRRREKNSHPPSVNRGIGLVRVRE